MLFGRKDADKPLKFKVKQTSDAAVVKVSGPAGIAEAEKLRRKLMKIVDKKTPLIVIDMSEMDFISSVGLGAIISAHLKCRYYGGRIRLAGPTPAVAQLLETTRLTKLFPIYPDVARALSE